MSVASSLGRRGNEVGTVITNMGGKMLLVGIVGENTSPKKLHIIIGFIGQGWFFFQKSAFQSNPFF